MSETIITLLQFYELYASFKYIDTKITNNTIYNISLP